MPTYPYECFDCGHYEDRFMSLRQWEQVGKQQHCSLCEGKMKQRVVPLPLHKTNTGWMKGCDDGFGPDDRTRKIALAKAKAAGVSTSGKRFIPDLCPQGDFASPMGWVSDLDEVKDRCKQLNLDCQGAVTHKATVYDTPTAEEKPYRVSPKIVEADVQKVNKEQHGGKMTEPQKDKLRSELTERYSGNI